MTNYDQLFFELVITASRAISDLQPINDQVTNYLYIIVNIGIKHTTRQSARMRYISCEKLVMLVMLVIFFLNQ